MNASAEFFDWILHTEGDLSSMNKMDSSISTATPAVVSKDCTLYPECDILDDEDDDDEDFLNSSQPSLASSDCCSSTASSASCCNYYYDDTSPFGCSSSDIDSNINYECSLGTAVECEISDYSSLDTVSRASTHSEESQCALKEDTDQPLPIKRRVSFSLVEVREYSLTVGDHPLCYDGLPLALDWDHCEEPYIRSIEESRERSSHYEPPRRLSFDERRNRLFSVNPYNDENERGEELNLMIKMLQNAWAINTILPPPDLYDIEEEDEDEDYLLLRREKQRIRREQQAKAKAAANKRSCENLPVIQWYRN